MKNDCDAQVINRDSFSQHAGIRFIYSIYFSDINWQYKYLDNGPGASITGSLIRKLG